MVQELIGKPFTVGIVGHVDPRTYPVPGGEPVRTQQTPMVLERVKLVTAAVDGVRLYDNSSPNVVVANVLVGGARDAALVQKQFEENGVDAVIHVLATWSMGWETQFFGHPEWLEMFEAKNGTSWPGAVLLNSVRASATAHLKSVWCSYPPDVEIERPGEEMALHRLTELRIEQFIGCAAAVVTMRGKSYVSIGGVSMGIAGSETISDLFAHYFGMKLIHVDGHEVYQRIVRGMYNKEEADHAAKWFYDKFKGRVKRDDGGSVIEIEALIRNWLIPMTLVTRGLFWGDDSIEDEERSAGHNAIAGGTAGQRYWTDWLPNWDFAEAWNSSSFDWNGRKVPFSHATENDWLNGMGMLFGTLMTGHASLFADLRTYWSKKAMAEHTGIEWAELDGDGMLHLINSGPAALDWATDPSLNLDAPEALKEEAIAGTTWHPAEPGYFPHGGLSTHFVTPGGLPVTLVRLNRVGLELTISVIEGSTVMPPEGIANFIRENTNPTWPDTFVVADNMSTFMVMNEGIDPNHVVAIPGHIGSEVLTLAAMLRIPADFANVEGWYPTLWNRLGGDFNACKTLGPRYTSNWR